MATFSRELLRSLTQPAFQQNLFAAAEQLGGMPARIVTGKLAQK